jgi:hypothetical protein
MVHYLHMLLNFPDLLKSFSAELASQFFLVDFPLFFQMDMFYVCCDVVGIKEALSADLALVIPLSGVGFPLKFKEFL